MDCFILVYILWIALSLYSSELGELTQSRASHMQKPQKFNEATTSPSTHRGRCNGEVLPVSGSRQVTAHGWPRIFLCILTGITHRLGHRTLPPHSSRATQSPGAPPTVLVLLSAAYFHFCHALILFVLAMASNRIPRQESSSVVYIGRT